MNIKEYKNPYNNQYVAPYRYSFFKDGRNLGRIIWVNNIDGISLKKCDSEWGL